MKVVCIEKRDFITIGKCYDVIDSIEWAIPKVHQIINDDGKPEWHNKWIFISLEEWREQQLDKIL